LRQTGHRDHPKLYARILTLLEKNPDGMVPYQIAKALHQNHCTIGRTYLPDLVEQGKVTATPIEKGRTLYKVVTVIKQNDKL